MNKKIQEEKNLAFIDGQNLKRFRIYLKDYI